MDTGTIRKPRLNICRPKRKVHRVLEALANGRSLNRFEAERELHDHCLNSTVSEIQLDYGITVCRRTETVPGYQGQPTHCCRYWLSPDQRQRALELLSARHG